LECGVFRGYLVNRAAQALESPCTNRLTAGSIRMTVARMSSISKRTDHQFCGRRALSLYRAFKQRGQQRENGCPSLATARVAVWPSTGTIAAHTSWSIIERKDTAAKTTTRNCSGGREREFCRKQTATARIPPRWATADRRGYGRVLNLVPNDSKRRATAFTRVTTRILPGDPV
jgi:hypothetical protein